MHARGGVIPSHPERAAWIGGLVVALTATAAADPTPKPVDIKAQKAKSIVLSDAQGGVYVVFRGDEPKVFYGPNAKTVYEQNIVGSSSDGDGGWDFSTWAPRVVDEPHLGSVTHHKDGTYEKTCRDQDKMVLTELSGDKAKAVVDKAAFVTSGIIRVPHLLARDDSGVYYYVDRIAKIYGGKGYRVFVGKKGAMKPMPLTDVASDSAGEVFSTKSGDLRLVRQNDNSKESMTWVKGGKRNELVFLDTSTNSAVIFKDLGIYTFLGTVCDNI
ncbi:MAG: hypothetical protein ABIY55_01340 [Kofleriaceae bacterium]